MISSTIFSLRWQRSRAVSEEAALQMRWMWSCLSNWSIPEGAQETGSYWLLFIERYFKNIIRKKLSSSTDDDEMRRPHKCDQCGKRFANSATFENHKRSHLRMPNISSAKKLHFIADDDPRKKAFECVVCGKILAGPGELSKHKLTHLGLMLPTFDYEISLPILKDDFQMITIPNKMQSRENTSVIIAECDLQKATHWRIIFLELTLVDNFSEFHHS